jgi:hypothetical protein
MTWDHGQSGFDGWIWGSVIFFNSTRLKDNPVYADTVIQNDMTTTYGVELPKSIRHQRNGYAWVKVPTNYKVGSRQELLFWCVMNATGGTSKEYFYSPQDYESFLGYSHE